MSIIDIFPKICKLFPGTTGVFLQVGMVLVSYYHSLSENVVVNTSFEEARGLEKFANVLLIPTQYLCEGQTVRFSDQEFEVKQRFQYKTKKRVISPIAITFFTPGLLLGCTVKGVALLNHEVKARHIALKAHFNSTNVLSNLRQFHALGIDTTDWREGEAMHPSRV